MVVNHGEMHWYLVYADKRQQIITVYDPLQVGTLLGLHGGDGGRVAA